MVDYAYTTVTGKIKPLLEKVRSVGIPTKVGGSWLKTLGFTSSNDASLIGVLKFIGFTDQSGIPTPVWTAYRGGKHKTVLGEAIKKGYEDLYAVYPDAHKQSNTDLSHVFTTSSSAGAQVIAKTVATFRALADEAEFPTTDGSAETSISEHTSRRPSAATSSGLPPLPGSTGNPEVHIDIQIHISPESSTEQIDKIFRSMARHLYGRKDD